MKRILEKTYEDPRQDRTLTRRINHRDLDFKSEKNKYFPGRIIL